MVTLRAQIALQPLQLGGGDEQINMTAIVQHGKAVDDRIACKYRTREY